DPRRAGPEPGRRTRTTRLPTRPNLPPILLVSSVSLHVLRLSGNGGASGGRNHVTGSNMGFLTGLLACGQKRLVDSTRKVLSISGTDSSKPSRASTAVSASTMASSAMRLVIASVLKRVSRQGQLQVLVAAQAQMLAEGTDAAFTGLHALRQFRD